jgi:hypothetical protein
MSLSTLSLPELYSAIIFDCDGTLVDSTRLYFRAWNVLFTNHGAEMAWAGFRKYWRRAMPARISAAGFSCPGRGRLLCVLSRGGTAIDEPAWRSHLSSSIVAVTRPPRRLSRLERLLQRQEDGRERLSRAGTLGARSGRFDHQPGLRSTSHTTQWFSALAKCSSGICSQGTGCRVSNISSAGTCLLTIRSRLPTIPSSGPNLPRKSASVERQHNRRHYPQRHRLRQPRSRLAAVPPVRPLS